MGGETGIAVVYAHDIVLLLLFHSHYLKNVRIVSRCLNKF